MASKQEHTPEETEICDDECERCHVLVTTDAGCEPTRFCHHCAQELVYDLLAACAALTMLVSNLNQLVDDKACKWIIERPAYKNAVAAIEKARPR